MGVGSDGVGEGAVGGWVFGEEPRHDAESFWPAVDVPPGMYPIPSENFDLCAQSTPPSRIPADLTISFTSETTIRIGRPAEHFEQSWNMNGTSGPKLAMQLPPRQSSATISESTRSHYRGKDVTMQDHRNIRSTVHDLSWMQDRTRYEKLVQW
nr:hypothetical protein CFP56_20264 [Quercus suber]